MIEVSTSLLNLSEEDYIHSLYNLEAAKTDYFHIDIMDGKFVENNTTERMKKFCTAINQISRIRARYSLNGARTRRIYRRVYSFKPKNY